MDSVELHELPKYYVIIVNSVPSEGRHHCVNNSNALPDLSELGFQYNKWLYIL